MCHSADGAKYVFGRKRTVLYSAFLKMPLSILESSFNPKSDISSVIKVWSLQLLGANVLDMINTNFY
jgi:hypothetical protein